MTVAKHLLQIADAVRASGDMPQMILDTDGVRPGLSLADELDLVGMQVEVLEAQLDRTRVVIEAARDAVFLCSATDEPVMLDELANALAAYDEQKENR